MTSNCYSVQGGQMCVSVTDIGLTTTVATPSTNDTCLLFAEVAVAIATSKARINGNANLSVSQKNNVNILLDRFNSQIYARQRATNETNLAKAYFYTTIRDSLPDLVQETLNGITAVM